VLVACGYAAHRRAMASGSQVFVLVHGAWHGGWCWSRVAALLRARGHRVFTPTQTGLGERAHLMSRDITFETFTQDVAGVLEAEELEDVVLVGHSFGGIAISGLVDRMPERVRRLVYLDARILENGQSPMDGSPLAEERRRVAEAASGGLFLPAPAPAAFGVPEGPDADWLRRRMTPHPFSVFCSTLSLAGPVGNGRPCTYLFCNDPVYAPLEQSRRWAQGRPGWQWAEIATGHDAMVTAPAALARMLEQE
jgi:pimeloyl-ACP methyl ester carboxylesterase